MDNKGFTLIEVLIYIAIIGIVITSFVTFALSIGNSRSQTYVVQEVHANARTALDLISQKIRSADDVVSPTEGNSESSLELSNPNLTFSVSNGVLNIGSTAITSDEVNVSSVSFTNLAPLGERDNIRVQMTVECRGDGSKEYEYSQSLQTAISIRK